MSTTREEVLLALQANRLPITAAALAERIRRPSYTVNSVLSRAFNYGEISRQPAPGRGKRFAYFPKEAQP